jgi:hypothetical protein
MGCSSIHGLRPVTPRFRSFAPGTAIPRVAPEDVEFQWEQFPNEKQAKGIAKAGTSITDLSYDLCVFAIEHGRYEAIHLQEGIRTNSFSLDHSLEPAKDYAWSVRARYREDGEQKTTEWSNYSNFGFIGIGWWYFRDAKFPFKTLEADNVPNKALEGTR